MPQARICRCDHIASNHKVIKVQYVGKKPVRATTYHECFVDGCNCPQFVQIDTVDCRNVNYRKKKNISMQGIITCVYGESALKKFMDITEQDPYHLIPRVIDQHVKFVLGK